MAIHHFLSILQEYIILFIENEAFHATLQYIVSLSLSLVSLYIRFSSNKKQKKNKKPKTFYAHTLQSKVAKR